MISIWQKYAGNWFSVNLWGLTATASRNVFCHFVKFWTWVLIKAATFYAQILTFLLSWMERAASDQNWTHSAAAHPKNADTIKQWGYLRWLMEAFGLRREGKGACFTSGFATGGPARCRSGPDVTVTLFSLMVWGCACPLVEGKSISAQSHACLLSSRRTDTQDTLTGSVYPAPAIETRGHCREKRTLHISSLFEDGERCISKCPVLPVSWERERKTNPGSTASVLALMTTLTTFLLKSHAGPDSGGAVGAFFNIWPGQQGDTWLAACSPLQFHTHLFASLSPLLKDLAILPGVLTENSKQPDQHLFLISSSRVPHGFRPTS